MFAIQVKYGFGEVGKTLQWPQVPVYYTEFPLPKTIFLNVKRGWNKNNT